MQQNKPLTPLKSATVLSVIFLILCSIQNDLGYLPCLIESKHDSVADSSRVRVLWSASRRQSAPYGSMPIGSACPKFTLQRIGSSGRPASNPTTLRKTSLYGPYLLRLAGFPTKMPEITSKIPCAARLRSMYVSNSGDISSSLVSRNRILFLHSPKSGQMDVPTNIGNTSTQPPSRLPSTTPLP